MASTTATPRPTDTTQSNAATHSSTAHVEQAPAQLQVAKISGLDNSPLSRLPPELRNEVFSMALTASDSYESDRKSFFNNFGLGGKTTPKTCPEISCALNIMATCKQIRSETENLFFSLNNIRVHRRDAHYTINQVKRIIPLLKKVPSILGPDSGRVILPFRYCTNAAELGPQWFTGRLKNLFIKTSRAIRPFQLFLGLDVAFHPWNGSENDERIICGQDTPLTMRDCSHFHLDLQVGIDPTAALSRIDKVIKDKLELLQQHRLHRLCPVRAMLRQFEKGLEDSRQYLRDINDFVSEFPDAV